MSVASFLTFTERPSSLDADAIVERVCAQWNFSRDAVVFPPAEQLQDFDVRFLLGTYLVGLRTHEVEGGLQLSEADLMARPFWPQDAPIPQAEHIITVVVQNLQPDPEESERDQQQGQVTLLGMITSTLVSLHPETAFVGINGGNSLIHPSWLARLSENPGKWSFELAVQIILGEGEAGIDGFTRGMYLYALPEIELRGGRFDARTTSAVVFNIGMWLLQHGAELEAGQLVPLALNDAPPVRVAELSSTDDGKRKLKLRVEAVPASDEAAAAASAPAASAPAASDPGADQPSDTSDANDPGIVAMVMRRTSASPISVDALIGQLERDWPELEGQVKTLSDEDGTILLQIGDRMVALANTASPQNLPLEELVEASHLWQPNLAVPHDVDQQIYVAAIRSGEAESSEPEVMVAHSVLVTRVVASLLGVDSDSRAVLVRSAGHVIAPYVFRDYAKRILPEPPTLLWVSLNIEGDDSGESGAFGFTGGLDAFGHRELEVQPGSGMSATTVRDVLVNTASYVVASDAELESGDTLGDEHNAKLVAQVAASSFGGDEEVTVLTVP